jgi:hypothetical protein
MNIHILINKLANSYFGVINRGRYSVLITNNPFDFIRWMIN